MWISVISITDCFYLYGVNFDDALRRSATEKGVVDPFFFFFFFFFFVTHKLLEE